MTSSPRASGDTRFSYVFEASGWLLTLLLGSLIFLLPQADAPGRQMKLMVTVALLAAANILFHRVMPESSDGPIRFAKEDKALLVSLATVLILSAFLYVVPEVAMTLAYLYFIPLCASTLALQEKVVLSEASFSLLAMLFLYASTRISSSYWGEDFILQLLIFATVAVCLAVVTRILRLAFTRADRLSVELSRRLDQLQVINMLVRQSEFTSQIDRLASRTGEIIADAVDTERHAVFVLGEAGLRRVGEGVDSDIYDRGLMSVEENLQVLRGVLETGVSRVFGDEPGGIERLIGNSRIRNMLVVPLRVRDASIGVLCLINRRSSTFAGEDVNYCELLAGFVATLMNAALLFQSTLVERQAVERMAKLMVGREIKMRELKERMRADDV